MKRFKTTDKLRLRASPSTDGAILGQMEKGTIVESDEYTWKKVLLADGRSGFCAAEYLEEVAVAKWFAPIRADKFKLTQTFLNPDPVNYPKTGCHPGVDYGTQGQDNVPLYFCSDGEVIESGVSVSFGNYFFYYVPEVDRTFLYFHLKNSAPAEGQYIGGIQCGIAGATGQAQGIHLHLECMRGRKTSTDRRNLYTSKPALMAAAEDADAFIRARL